MSRRGVLALALTCAAACAPRPRATAPTPSPPAGSALATRGTSPAGQFESNLTLAQGEAEREGWVLRERVDLPGHLAALLLFERSAAPAAQKRARVTLVGVSERRISIERGVIEVARTKSGSPLWDLRGDGSASVVLALTACGVSCGIATPLVFDLRSDDFSPAKAAPECPTCARDEDGDGVPELETRLASLVVAACARTSCGPSSQLLVEVRGLERWDGQRWARDLAAFAPLYMARLRSARLDAEAVRRTRDKGSVCPLHPLTVAARLYVFSRLIGESKGDSLAAADAVMKGFDTETCKKEYDLLATPKSWSELRRELETLSLPELGGR